MSTDSISILQDSLVRKELRIPPQLLHEVANRLDSLVHDFAACLDTGRWNETVLEPLYTLREFLCVIAKTSTALQAQLAAADWPHLYKLNLTGKQLSRVYGDARWILARKAHRSSIKEQLLPDGCSGRSLLQLMLSTPGALKNDETRSRVFRELCAHQEFVAAAQLSDINTNTLCEVLCLAATREQLDGVHSLLQREWPADLLLYVIFHVLELPAPQQKIIDALCSKIPEDFEYQDMWNTMVAHSGTAAAQFLLEKKLVKRPANRIKRMTTGTPQYAVFLNYAVEEMGHDGYCSEPEEKSPCQPGSYIECILLAAPPDASKSLISEFGCEAALSSYCTCMAGPWVRGRFPDDQPLADGHIMGWDEVCRGFRYSIWGAVAMPLEKVDLTIFQ